MIYIILCTVIGEQNLETIDHILSVISGNRKTQETSQSYTFFSVVAMIWRFLPKAYFSISRYA